MAVLTPWVSVSHLSPSGRYRPPLVGRIRCSRLRAEGGWSGEDKKVLLCAVRAAQCYRVEEIVRGIDPEAFVIVMEANEIAGEGFRPITEDKVG